MSASQTAAVRGTGRSDLCHLLTRRFCPAGSPIRTVIGIVERLALPARRNETVNRRTSFITAAAVGGALLVGTGAIAANIGVLRAADDDSIGNLSAETPVVTPGPSVDARVVDVYVEDPLVAEPAASSSVAAEAPVALAQEFTVESAGAVTVEHSPTGLFVSDVQVSDGWEWSAEQLGSSDVTVTFVSEDTTYEFTATVGADGQIEARVDQPIIDVVHVPAPAPAPDPSAGSSSSGRGDDDHDDDHDDEDDDHEDEDADDDHYEGRDDDD